MAVGKKKANRIILRLRRVVPAADLPEFPEEHPFLAAREQNHRRSALSRPEVEIFPAVTAVVAVAVVTAAVVAAATLPVDVGWEVELAMEQVKQHRDFLLDDCPNVAVEHQVLSSHR